MKMTFNGPFRALNLEHGVWQLTSPGLTGCEIYLQHVGPGVLEASARESIDTVSLEWRPGSVNLEVSGTSGVRRTTAGSALVHEPQPALYANLPLATFDDDAQRFWTRVFRLMRIPGGRYLLGFVARRRRNVSAAPP